MNPLAGERVAVLGDGVIGLATAFEAIRCGAHVTIYSDTHAGAMASHASSDKACALWFPVLLDQADQDQLDRWCISSYAAYSDLYEQGCPGIHRVTNIEIIDGESSFRTPPHAIQRLPDFGSSREGLSGLRDRPAGMWSFSSFVISMPVFLAEMRQRLAASGVKLVRAHFKSRSDLLRKVQEQILFDCLGAGSSEIFGDDKVRLVKGHLLMFPPAAMHHAVGRYDIAVIPREDALVCGSLFLDQFDTNEPTSEDRDRILTEVNSWVDMDLFNVGLGALQLSSDRIETELTGVRPCRIGGVRLECEEFDGRLVIHDYGHGGSGVTIAPGCAREALALASMTVSS